MGAKLKKYGSMIAIPALVAFGVNETEEWRMTRAIKNGELRPRPSSVNYDARISQFPQDEVKTVVRHNPAKFCGLIGLKSTGKSTELEQFGCDIENKNILYCTLDGRQSADLDDVLYETMTHSLIIRMPWFLYQIAFARPSRRHIIERVFLRVLKDTKEPVTIVLDISSEKTLPYGLMCLRWKEKDLPVRCEQFLRSSLCN